MGQWTVIYSIEAADWIVGLSDDDYRLLMGRIELLEEHGPGLGRPAVDTITGSDYPNMKELRAGTLRALFAFDPQRQALILVGGDKRDRWTEWYAEAIPHADELFTAYLQSLEDE